MITETICWHDPKSVKPDDQATVLVETRSSLDAGFIDAGIWRWANAERVQGTVIAWAEMPKGILNVK